MVRGLSFLSLLAALLVGGWLLTAQNHASTEGRTPSQRIDAARQAALAVTFQQAATQLEQAHALNGTYAGGSVAGFGVTLLKADASSYCLQTPDGASHLTGPGGAPAAGPC